MLIRIDLIDGNQPRLIESLTVLSSSIKIRDPLWSQFLYINVNMQKEDAIIFNCIRNL